MKYLAPQVWLLSCYKAESFQERFKMLNWVLLGEKKKMKDLGGAYLMQRKKKNKEQNYGHEAMHFAIVRVLSQD